MTGLGASIYLGFFALAALWLFLTSDGPLDDARRAALEHTRESAAD